MARFLIVDGGGRGGVLAAALEREGHVSRVVTGVERDSLAQVAFVFWLREDSPESFLLRAIDSSMRGFLYEGGRHEAAVSQTASRNSIPAVAFAADRDDMPAWLAAAQAAASSLIGRSGST